MAAFRKRNAKKIEILISDATYARLLLVRAGQLIGDDEDTKRGVTVQLFTDEYLEQRIDEDFTRIYGMSFDEFRGRHRTLPRIYKKPSYAHELAAAELEEDPDAMRDERASARRSNDAVF